MQGEREKELVSHSAVSAKLGILLFIRDLFVQKKSDVIFFELILQRRDEGRLVVIESVPEITPPASVQWPDALLCPL